jgi:hypothetical protein
MYRPSALAVFLSLAPLTAPAQAQPAARGYSTSAIDRYLRSEMSRQNIPGISLAVVKLERAPILKLTPAEQRGLNLRVYRAEEKDMVEFYTANYSADSSIDDIELFSEY